jgi:hypothetical protein
MVEPLRVERLKAEREKPDDILNDPNHLNDVGGYGFSPDAGQKNGRSNRKRN